MQYPLVELLIGILFATLAWAQAPLFFTSPVLSTFVFLDDCVIAFLLMAIAVYDLRHTIIPDEWAYSFAGFALASQFLAVPISQMNIVSVLIAGPLTALPLFLLWLFSSGRAMGFGDVKLALGIGWLLGTVQGISAIFGGFVIGAIVSIPLLFLSTAMGERFLKIITPIVSSRKQRLGFTIKSEVPFGPFLIASTILFWFAMIYGVRLISFTW